MEELSRLRLKWCEGFNPNAKSGLKDVRPYLKKRKSFVEVIQIKKGKDIKLKGAAEKQVEELDLPKQVAIQPPDFRGVRLRLRVKEGDVVKVGTPVLEDKDCTQVHVVSPVSGKVVAINRGEKRALLQVVIETDGKQETVAFKKHPAENIPLMSHKEIVSCLLEGGVWPVLRQRPFSKIARVDQKPKSIFVHAMNTEPLAMDVDYRLNGQAKGFHTGLDILAKLTEGSVHVCFHKEASSDALANFPSSSKIKYHRFDGPHPAGNVGTHIHHVDPVHKGEFVWFVEAEDVLRIAKLFVEGVFSPVKVVVTTGEGVEKRVYKKTIIGAPVSHIIGEAAKSNMRYISGSVLTGINVGAQGYVCFYDSQITVIPEGGKREILGWALPGLNKYSFSKTFASSLINKNEDVSLDADEHGGHRAIVFNSVYDDYVALDVMTYFLLKAALSGDIEEAERLGILECDEEDFALATFACPSKTDVGGIIREGLDLIEKEG